MRGWISLWRKIFENPIVPPAKKFSRFEAWIWILLNVNHAEGKVVIGNEIVKIPVGSRVTSIKKLCTTFGWGNTKVRNFLKLLANDGMIEYDSNTMYTTISVCNYSTYQNNQQANNTPTTRKQTKRKSKANTNNNVIKEKNNKYNKGFLDFWNSYPRKVGKKVAFKSWQNLDSNEKTLATNTLPNQKREWAKQGTEIEFIPHPSTWLNQGRYEDEAVGKSLQEQNAERNQKKQNERAYKEALQLKKEFEEGNEEVPISIQRTIWNYEQNKEIVI